MPSDYAPLYFASQVLPDGRLLVEGGEYNFLQGVETNLGAIYDPLKNKWTNVDPPTGWSTIGDSPAVILSNGKFMMGMGGFSTTRINAFFNPKTPDAKRHRYADGLPRKRWAAAQWKVLLADTPWSLTLKSSIPKQKWSNAGSTIVNLAQGSQRRSTCIGGLTARFSRWAPPAARPATLPSITPRRANGRLV
jgi:hypothetical protein